MGGFYWIASYPKSGNTWIRLLLESVIAGGAAPEFGKRTKFAPIVAQRADFELFLHVEASDLTVSEQAELRHDLACVMAAEVAESQFRKVHDHWGHTPSGRPLFPEAVTLGSVYLVRDPRDVAISWAHHCGCTIDEAIAFMAREDAALTRPIGWQDQLGQRLTSWSAHVESWMTALPAPMLVSYERLSQQPAAVLAEVVAYVGLSASDAVIGDAVAANHFERLKAEESAAGFDVGQASGRAFFRRGLAGGWRDTLTAAQADRIVRDHGAMIERLDYL